MSYAVGEWEKPTRQPRGLIPIGRNQSRKVETIVLKWVITKVKTSERRRSLTQAALHCVPAAICDEL